MVYGNFRLVPSESCSNIHVALNVLQRKVGFLLTGSEFSHRIGRVWLIAVCGDFKLVSLECCSNADVAYIARLRLRIMFKLIEIVKQLRGFEGLHGGGKP